LSVAANLVGNVTPRILLTDGILGMRLRRWRFSLSRILEALVTQIIALRPRKRLRSIASHAGRCAAAASASSM